MASSLPLNTEERPLLPKEIWHHIWSFVDFETLQKSCVAVSKTWYIVHSTYAYAVKTSFDLTLKLSNEVVNFRSLWYMICKFRHSNQYTLKVLIDFCPI